MAKLEPVTEDAWAKTEKVVHAEIMKLARGKGASEGFKEMAKDIKRDDDNTVQLQCKLTSRIFNETLDEFEDGEMTYDEFCEDFYKSCKQISKVKGKDMGQQDEKEEMEDDD